MIAKRPLDVIQMLTVNSAELLRESDNFGTVEPGKYADLRPGRRESRRRTSTTSPMCGMSFSGGKRVFGMSDRPQLLV